MSIRIALWLMMSVLAAHAAADGLFTLSKRANTTLVGETFDVVLFEEAPTDTVTRTAGYRSLLGLTPDQERMLALLLSDRLQILMDLDFCEQDISINVFICSTASTGETKRCTMTPLTVRFEQGNRRCKL